MSRTLYGYYFLSAFKIKETTKITIIAPISAGMIGTPPHTGPQVPNNLLPTTTD